MSSFGTYTCNSTCKPKWVKGKGSFQGWKLKLCSIHMVIHEMKKED